MQFTEARTLNHNHQMIPLSTNSMMLNKLSNNPGRPWPAGLPSSTKPIATGLADANCMEQLLVHCATALETNDATLAQQILWVLNNIAPADGDSNQRLTCGFLRALVSRAARTGSCKILAAAINNTSTSLSIHKFSVIELASFVDLTPWHRFGFTAANAAILEAVDGYSSVHIVDLSLTHCMQIPTLIDALATRLESPPLLKLTVAGATEDVPPMLELSYEELGSKLMNFARSRNITMEFRVLPSSSLNGFASLIDQIRAHNLVHSHIGEALVVNCHMMLHYIPEETLSMGDGSDNPNPNLKETPEGFSFRNLFLKEIRTLEPTLVILVEEDADFTSRNLVTRLRSAFNYLWIPYDTVDTFLAKGSKQRQWYEADICWKIENVIAEEGVRRVERPEPKGRWVQRMRNSGFREISFGDEVGLEVKTMLDEHAAGWGSKREDDELVLTWKGHNVVFASAWVPSII